MSSHEIIDDQYLIAPGDKPRSGGMAEVRKAFDILNNNQTVAIKFFNVEIDTNKHYIEAYSREQKILQEVEHPYVVRLLGGGKSIDGRRYLVLEWLDSSLHDILKDGPLDSWELFMQDVGSPILEALVHLYTKGILHRDLKPQNVLLDPNGVAKLADFGISKLKQFAAPAVTVSRFRSEPFSPPEVDDGLNSETRDVYGFAALVLASFSSTPLATYDDVYNALSRFTGPTAIARVLEKALSRDPEERFHNIVELKSAIEDAESRRASSKKNAINKCYYKVDSRVASDIHNLRSDPGLDYQKIIQADLSDVWGISPARNATTSLQFSIFCTQFMYRIEVDRESRSFFRIVRAIPFQPSVLEQNREDAWSGDITFFPLASNSPPAGAQNAISILIEGVAENELDVLERKRIAQSERVFKGWNASLLAKRDIESRRMPPLSFRDAIADGHRLTVRVDSLPELDLRDKQIKIEFSIGLIVYGEVEDVYSDEIIIWCEQNELTGIPKVGQLTLDSRAANKAISRQRTALDAVRFGRAVRPELRELLVSPAEAKMGPINHSLTFAQETLDESKQDAVQRALAADSFLVVEGPPGTGKTRFITEVVVQHLKKNPDSKILISSQTHVALDNALDRIRKVAPNIRLTRIGRKDDRRVSPEVADMLIGNRVDDWLKVVQFRSETFLRKYASNLGVIPDEVSLEIAVARVRAAIEEKISLEFQIQELEREMLELSKQDREMEAKGQGDTYLELKEAIRETTESLKEFNREYKFAKDSLKRSRQQLGSIPGGEPLKVLDDAGLQTWENSQFERNDKTQIIRDLLQLSEEWYLRFGRSDDFHAALISDSQVIAGTCIGFAGTRGMDKTEFDLCIIDEASKATVTELLVPMSRAKKWVLVGDRKQLPPFVDDALENPTLLEKYKYTVEDLNVSLLSILIEKLPENCIARLLHQHRMTRQIGDLVSNCFYESSVISELVLPNDILAPVLPKPVTWFSTSGLETRLEKSSGRSFINPTEGNIIRELLRRFNGLANTQGKEYSIAVLAGYASQRSALQRIIDSEYQNLANLQIMCNTVDAFQGKESDIAIYSVTRSNNSNKIGFLRDLRRLNVALSRAKIGLAIVGDSGFLRTVQGANPWIDVLDYIESHPQDCEFEYL